jgi:hypothetical protein
MRRLAAAHPAADRCDQHQLDATAEDLGHIVDFLAAALYATEPDIFLEFVDWTAAVLGARNVPPAALRSGLTLIRPHSERPAPAPAATPSVCAADRRINGSRAASGRA